MRLLHGDCLAVLPTLEDASVDAVICDPPYPEISRAYGRLTEAEWWDLMMGVVKEVRRLLKPTGSAVFILQPNSRKVGSMRGWLWEFMAWVCREWNMVQDAWWWNNAALPTAHCHRNTGLMRPSVKAMVWCGPANCWRDQSSVLLEECERNRARRLEAKCDNDLVHRPSGYTIRYKRSAAAAGERGGTVPFNLLPMGNTNSVTSAGAHGHGAGTPLALCRWWTRYISPPGGLVLDPFAGSGTIALAAWHEDRDCIGIEKEEGYIAIARKRLDAAVKDVPLFAAQDGKPDAGPDLFAPLDQ